MTSQFPRSKPHLLAPLALSARKAGAATGIRFSLIFLFVLSRCIDIYHARFSLYFFFVLEALASAPAELSRSSRSSG